MVTGEGKIPEGPTPVQMRRVIFKIEKLSNKINKHKH